jgi:hypothetical protein
MTVQIHERVKASPDALKTTTSSIHSIGIGECRGFGEFMKLRALHYWGAIVGQANCV